MICLKAWSHAIVPAIETHRQAAKMLCTFFIYRVINPLAAPHKYIAYLQGNKTRLAFSLAICSCEDFKRIQRENVLKWIAWRSLAGIGAGKHTLPSPPADRWFPRPNTVGLSLESTQTDFTLPVYPSLLSLG